MIDVTTVKREAIIEDAAKWFAGEMMRLESQSNKQDTPQRYNEHLTIAEANLKILLRDLEKCEYVPQARVYFDDGTLITASVVLDIKDDQLDESCEEWIAERNRQGDNIVDWEPEFCDDSRWHEILRSIIARDASVLNFKGLKFGKIEDVELLDW